MRNAGTSDYADRNPKFTETRWSLVLAAGETAAPDTSEALEKLCQTYWYPLYVFIRRQGHSPEDAQDLTQAFFARVLEKKYFKLASPDRGKFRSFLLKSVNHFLVNDWVRSQADKRGGGRRLVSLDEQTAECLYLREPAASITPEALYDKRWAVAVVEQALVRLREDYARAGKETLFDSLKPLLLDETSTKSYSELACELRISEGAVKVAVHRLRQRFGKVVRAEIGHTVATPEHIEEELRCLMAALSS